MPFAATWMDLEIVLLSEVSQKNPNIIWYHLYGESKNNNINQLIYKTNRLTDIQNELMVTKGDSSGRGVDGDKLGILD